AVIAVLLVACANVANMQLARGIARSRELALRTALGATRGRIIAHLLIESLMLAGIGLGLGLALTFAGNALLRASIPPSVGEYIVEPRMSWRVLLFAIGATMACILIVGVLPAIKVSHVDPNELLKSGAGTGATRRHRRGYGFLVVAELALTLGLLSGATVMVRGAIHSASAWLGYDPMRLATGYFIRRPARKEYILQSEWLSSVAQRMRALPGIVNAAADMSGSYAGGGALLADSSGVRELIVAGYSYHVVSPSYFRTMGLPIIAGRDFRDGERDQPAIVIDEYTARKLWPNANPVGALMKLGNARSQRPFVRIVGVVGENDEHGKPQLVDLSDFGATIGYVYYLPGPADTLAMGPYGVAASVTLRTSRNPATVLQEMRTAGVTRALTMDDAMGLSRGRESRGFLAKLFTLFAALGLGLAAFGVYGVVAHSVAERRREIGVRIALGATARDVLHAVLRESVIIALLGVALGLLFTKYGVMLVAQFSANEDIFNAPLFAGVALFLASAAAASALVPAMRATRVDPTESLRSE